MSLSSLRQGLRLPPRPRPAARGCRGLIAFGEYDDSLRLSNPMRKNDRTADQLVGLLRVDSQPDGDINGLVEFRRVELLEDGDGLIVEAPPLRPPEPFESSL